MNKNYETLGLKPSASQEEIKNTYHKLSQKFHPDNNNGDEYFSEIFKNYKEAYEVLTENSHYGTDNHNNDLINTANKPKDSLPEILKFESDKDSFEEGESIRLNWQTVNADKVIIKPFGPVDPSGTKIFKLKNFNKRTLSITLQATSLFNETLTKTITLKNNVVEFDFTSLDDEDEDEVTKKPEAKIEPQENLQEKPEVHANSFATPVNSIPISHKEETFFSFNGRIRRSTYFGRALLLGIPGIFFYVLMENSYYDEGTLIIAALGLLAIALLALMQTVKRLHDLNQTGWLSLLQIIPVVSFIFGLYLLFADGTKGNNQYGKDPKGRL